MAAPAIPTTQPAIRIANLFNRRLTTPWNEKEVKAFKKIGNHFEDLGVIERYYEFERRKGDKGWHRRDIQTFLNNYFGEADRARTWAARFNRGSQAKKISTEGKPLSDEEFAQAGKIALQQLAAFKQQLKG